MPLVLKLKSEIVLGPHWMDEVEFRLNFQGDLPRLLELLKEDISSLIEDAGGLEGIIEEAEWKDANKIIPKYSGSLAPRLPYLG